MTNSTRKFALIVFLLASFLIQNLVLSEAQASGSSKPMSLGQFMTKPKLVVVLVVDQCRSDFLTRFHKRMTANGAQGGLRYLMAKGAYYPFAKFDILQSMTCPGHATVLTGAYPNQMGIPLNEWYDTSLKSQIYCASDDKSPIVGRQAGDLLVVGLNTDASVSKLKGPSRPVQHELDRAEIMAALGCVDFVTLFGEETPQALIETVKPDVLVKGGDWTPDKIVGAPFVLSRGGTVRSLSFQPGRSTSSIIEKIKS